jgi:hypothetical protein
VRFRTLGCYPLTGAVESTPTRCPSHHPGDAADATSERQGRVIDHDGRFDGEEEAGGLFLMAHVSDLIAEDIDAYLKQHEHKSCCASSPAAASTTARAR